MIRKSLAGIIGILLSFVTGLGFGQEPVNSSPNVPSRDLVLLRRVVPANYYAPSFTSEQLTELLTKSASRSVDVQPGENLASIVVREFGFGQTSTPELYAQVEKHILNANVLGSPIELKPGYILVPDIPKAALTQPSVSNIYNALPKLSVLGNKSMAATGRSWHPMRQAFTLSPTVSSALREGSQFVQQLRLLSKPDALKLVKDSRGSKFEYAADAATITVKLSQGAGNVQSPPLLAPATSNRIRALLAQTPKSQPILVILDDGWPDATSFNESRDFFVGACRIIRDKYKLGSVSIPQYVRSQKETNFPLAPYPANSMHSSMIKTSLVEFQGLDAHRRVKVIFLPMINAQRGAGDLLRELIQINQAAKLMGPALGKVPAPPDIIAKSRETADLVVSRLDVSIPVSQGAALTLQSDQAVVEALINALKLYSDAIAEPHFISLSWTVPDLEFQVFLMAPALGLTVVAAGNENGVNAVTTNTQFAARSVSPGDMLAVMNMDAVGTPTCNSSVLETDQTVAVLGFGFQGAVSNDICGTSFSAPRVAWLLAAREAAVADRPSENVRHLWAARLRKQLESFQQAGGAVGYQRFLLNPEKLF